MFYSGRFDNSLTEEYDHNLADIWEFDFNSKLWRCIIEFEEESTTLQKINEKCENRKFEYIRENPIFAKFRDEIVLLNGKNILGDKLQDGVKFSIKN